jgi:ketosteroid isomerase-like protein
MNRFLLLSLAACMMFSCTTRSKTPDTEMKEQIAAAEKAFEQMAADKGIAEAFWYYADSSAVIKRENDTLIHGREAIRNYYAADFYKTASVKWSPDFIDVSGNMAYTYGKYTWQTKDSSGKVSEYRGVFHTVWKKQADGSWKYVWD